MDGLSSWLISSLEWHTNGIRLLISRWHIEIRVNSTCLRNCSGWNKWAFSTKSTQYLSNIPDRPLPELGVRPVADFKVEGTAFVSESLESMVEAPNCSNEEMKWIIKLTRECVSGDFKGLCSIPAPPCWEGGGRLYVNSPCVCVDCDIETPKGISEELLGGVGRDPESGQMSIYESFWEGSLALALFLAFTFEGDDFL